MAERYSVWSLLKHAMGGHKSWERAWRDPEPKKSYDVIIVGGGVSASGRRSGGEGKGSRIEARGGREGGAGLGSGVEREELGLEAAPAGPLDVQAQALQARGLTLAWLVWGLATLWYMSRGHLLLGLAEPQAYARAQRRLDELVYRLRQSGSEIASPDIQVGASGTTAERWWMIRIDQRGGGLGSGTPVLNVGWVPHQLVFAARGAAPRPLRRRRRPRSRRAPRSSSTPCVDTTPSPTKRARSPRG